MRITLIAIAMLSYSLPAAASCHAEPLAKDGACPSGYFTSGAYCVPSTGARRAIKRLNSCPSGFFSSGNYCVASTSNEAIAIPKVGGSCPSGWYTSGKYCLRQP